MNLSKLTVPNMPRGMCVCVVVPGNLFGISFSYLHISIEDKPDQNISEHFAEAIEFIHRARADGGML